MSKMPDDGAKGTNGQLGYGQRTAKPEVPAQPGAPQPPMQQEPTRQQPPMQQRPARPSSRIGGPVLVEASETRVTGRRIVQYIIDYILAGIVPGLAYWLFDANAGSIDGVRWLVATIIALAAYFVYWVVIPYGSRGQTFGMKLLRLRVISKDGGKASMLQWFVRGIFLIIDTFVFGLVGLITMLCSRYRQRVGDHAAGTLVVSGRYGPQY
jgi:uncharacterized RDD family membrane protein YckC